MVPGHDQVTLQGLVDAHGNAFPDTLQAIAQSSPVVNGFAGNVVAVTVANAGGDYVQAVTTQAFDPDSALDPALWSLVVAGNPVDLTQQTLDYDLIAKTVTIDLSFDLHNGDSFTLQALGVLDVDGDAFNLGQTQVVAGETTAPTALSARQDRSVEPAGTIVDVQMSEDVDAATAETLANWSSSGGQTVVGATLLPGLDAVRLEFDAPMIPGDVTLSAQAVLDLAGNPMLPQAGIALTSTDTTPPAATEWSGSAREGADNDVIEVFFDDDMVPADVLDVARWSLESPVGTPRPLAGANVEYEEVLHRARLQLVNGENLHRDDDFRVVMTNVRDLGGNALPATPLSGPVVAESTLPYVHAIWRPLASPDQVEVRFSEPCDLLEDLYDAGTNPAGTRYVLRDSGGVLRGLATAATSMDGGLGARVSFGIVVDPADTVDVMGAADLAGNPLFPALAFPTVDEDAAEPGLALGLSTLTSVSGEENDVLTVRFDRPISPWTAADHVHYTVTGPTEVEKRTLEVTFDGVDTVTLPLKSNVGQYDLLTGSGYDLQVAGLRTAQGVPMSFPATESGVVVAGTRPRRPCRSGRCGSIRPRRTPCRWSSARRWRRRRRRPSRTTCTTAARARVGRDARRAHRAPRLRGRAGAGLRPRAPGRGPRREPERPDRPYRRRGGRDGPARRLRRRRDPSGLRRRRDPGAVRRARAVDVGAELRELHRPDRRLPAQPRGRFALLLEHDEPRPHPSPGRPGAPGRSARHRRGHGDPGLERELDGAGLQVGGTTSGDTTPPAFANAFVNRRIDPNGTVVDVLWTEDVDQAFALAPQNWTATAPATVLSVSMRERNHARVVLSAPLAPSGTLQTTGAPDLAGNLAGTIQVDPTE
jgi:hypothetical protein